MDINEINDMQINERNELNKQLKKHYQYLKDRRTGIRLFLEYQSFSYKRIDKIDLSYGTLNICRFDDDSSINNSNLHKTHFVNVAFKNTHFRNCDLSDAVFDNCIFKNICIYSNCNTENVKLYNCKSEFYKED